MSANIAQDLPYNMYSILTTVCVALTILGFAFDIFGLFSKDSSDYLKDKEYIKKDLNTKFSK